MREMGLMVSIKFDGFDGLKFLNMKRFNLEKRQIKVYFMSGNKLFQMVDYDYDIYKMKGKEYKKK